jgi:putative endonuclease
MNKRTKGSIGETRAAQFLVRNGYNILQRNYRTTAGEIDIIARNLDQLVFVEVKAWKHMELSDLEYAIGRNKQRRIIESSKKYVVDNPGYADFNFRYDVIFITMNDDRIFHLNNAFSEVD